MPKENLSEVTLKEQIEWGCMQGVDCDPVVNMKEVSCADQSWYVKAAYVMNYYFNAHGRDEASCYFNNNAMLTYDNPSKYYLQEKENVYINQIIQDIIFMLRF